MSIATAPRTSAPSFTRPEIASPLAKLRRAIQTYVVIEGVALAVVWACLWLWATFLIDWGMFAGFGADYVRDASDTARIVLRGIFTLALWGGLAYIVGCKVLYRLLATFNEPALALVLERRFPQLLEDRLVTAVELADPAIAETYGFSKPMIEDTTRQAAERVEQIAVGQVFNRQRLVAWVAIALAELLVGIVFAILATNTAAIWMERDLLLQDTYWPRRTMLELPDFADGDTKAVPHGADFKVNVRALKWVVATKENKEGWRRVERRDVASLIELRTLGSEKEREPRSWELSDLDAPVCGFLPESWRHLSLDEIEARIESATLDSSSPDAQARLAELGHTIIDYVLARIAESKEQGKEELDLEVRALLPESWRSLPLDVPRQIMDGTSSTMLFGMETLKDNLAAAKRLTPTEIKRLQAVAAGDTFCEIDALQEFGACLSPFHPPILTVGVAQRILSQRHDSIQPLALSAHDRDQLPRHWVFLSAKDIQARLGEFRSTHSPERVGSEFRARLLELFKDLDARAAQSRIGRRVQFRKLDVPPKVTIEFEQIQTEEERARGKVKRAEPKVNRIPGTNDFVYEFKKIDRPLRFRVGAGDDATPWYTIDVKPLPVLTSLTRQQDELGYVHGNNERVQTGPFPVSVEGSESKFDVPAGTRLRLEGNASKPLQWVQVKPLGQATEHTAVGRQLGHALASPLGLDGPLGLMVATAGEDRNPIVQKLEHIAGETNFRFALRELAAEDVRLEITFQDADGINGRRLLAIGVLADKEAEFAPAGFEIVNRKMITAQAMVPFSGHIRDDHGLLGLHYEVTVEKADRTVVLKKRFPMVQFSPLVVPAESRTGLRFEKREQVTPGRLLSATLGDGRVGDAWFAPLVLNRLPLTGYAGLWQMPACDLAKEYVFEYRQRPGSQVVVEEFFDSLLLRAQRDKPIEIDGKQLTLPYRLTIRIVATDNRMRGGPNGSSVAASQESQSPETFDFAVVGEEELLLEAGKREESLHDTSEEIVSSLKKQHVQLQKIAAEFPSLQPNEFRRIAADAQDVLRAVREEKSRLDVEVTREFRNIYRELVLNRVTEQYLARVDQRICTPLERILLPGQEFGRADDAIDRLARLIEADKDKTPREALTAAVEETDNVIRKLEDILKEMKKLMEFNKALLLLQDIIKTQSEINKVLHEKWEIIKKKELDGKP